MRKKAPFGKKQKFTAAPKAGTENITAPAPMFGSTPKKPEPDLPPRKSGGNARGARMARLSGKLI